MVRDSGQIRALRASARPHIFSYVHTIFLFTGEVLYCLIVKTHFKRPSLCDYQFIIIRIQFFVTSTSSCHTFKEAKANGGSPQLSSPCYSQIIATFRRVGGDLVMKLTHKRGPRKASQSPWGLENNLLQLGVTGRSPTVCLHSIINRAKLHSSIKSVCLNFKTVFLRAAPVTIYRQSRIHRQFII